MSFGWEILSKVVHAYDANDTLFIWTRKNIEMLLCKNVINNKRNYVDLLFCKNNVFI